MENGEKSPEVADMTDPKAFFLTERGERAYYAAVKPTDEVLLPLTRDGFEAMLERVCGQFTPPLPMDDSTRKVFSGWVHHIANEVNTTTIERMGKILYKSVSNALTWTIDQEIKAKQRKEVDEKIARELIAKKTQKIEMREQKYKKKGTHVTVTPKKNETSQ